MKKALLFLSTMLMCMMMNAQTAWSENFDGMTSGQGPTGWTLIEDELTNYSNYSGWGKSWIVLNWDEAGTDKVAVSVSYTTVATDCDRWMISPAIEVPATGYSLYCRVWGYTTSYPEKVRIMVSTSGTEKSDFTTTLADVVMNGTTYGADWNDILVGLDAYAGQTIHLAFVNHGDGYYTIVDNIEVKVFEASALALTDISCPPYVPAGGSFNVRATVKNMGSSPLTSFDVTYSIAGGAEQTEHVSGVDIAPFASYTHVITTSYAEVGNVTIQVSASNPNGVADADASDNSGSVSLEAYNPSDYTPRASLLEHFTTAQCQYCPAGHQRLHAAIEGFEDNIVWVAHHVGYGTDNMTLTESNEIAALYGTNQTWAPAMMIDRDPAYSSGNESNGVVGSVGDVSTIVEAFTAATGKPAEVSISWDAISYDPNTREVKVTVTGQFYQDFTGNPQLTLWVTEDSIFGSQIDASAGGTVNNYQHDHVLRYMANGPWGDADAFTATTAGSKYVKEFTFTLPSNVTASHARLVAFLHDQNSSITKRFVLNATKTKYLTDPKLDIPTVAQEAEASMTVYPNPTSEMVYISAGSAIRSLTLTDLNGRTIKETGNLNANVVEFNVSNLEAGLYFVSITTDHGTATRKLSVNR